MTPKKRSRFRANPEITNHIAYKNLYARWQKRTPLNELQLFQSRDFAPVDFLRPLTLAAVGNLSITSACTYYRTIKIPCPSPELLLKHCREEDPEQMEIHVNQALEQHFRGLPGKIRREFRKRGTVIIDFHVDPYYGNPENPHVTTGKVKQSTSRGYSYLTAELYAPRGKQTIAVIFRRPGESINDLFGDLFSRIELILQPKLLLFDGEFAIVQILKKLQSRGIPFIARKSITPRLKPLALAYSLTDSWERLRTFRAISFLDKTKTHEATVQVTFQRVNGTMKALVAPLSLPLTPEEADRLYRQRFAIETGYRDKHPFQARTCSKNLSVRLLLFLFAILLWNLWQAFLLLVNRGSIALQKRLTAWRRQLRTVKLFLLRDELL